MSQATSAGPKESPKPTKVMEASRFLNDRLVRIRDILPDKMKSQAERFINRALITFSKNQNLMECTLDSFFQCVIAAAEVGFAIDGKLAHAVPRKGIACFQLDYKGMVALARRSNLVKDCFAHIVYRNDEFTQCIKNGISELYHVQSGERSRALVLGAYAIIIFPDGYWRHEWMQASEIEAIEARSAAGAGFSPWRTDWGEMARKTVLRRLLKLYMDADNYLSIAMSHEDDDVIDGQAVESKSAEASPPSGRVKSMRQLPHETLMPSNFSNHAGGDFAEASGHTVAPEVNLDREVKESPPAPSPDSERGIKAAELKAWLDNELSQERLSGKVLLEINEKLKSGCNLFSAAELQGYTDRLDEHRKKFSVVATAKNGRRSDDLANF